MRVEGYWAIFFNEEYDEYEHILFSNLWASNYYTNNM